MTSTQTQNGPRRTTGRAAPPDSPGMNRKRAIVLRARLAFGGVLVFALAILARLLYVQIAQGDYWREQMAQNSIRRSAIQPTRGNIYSDNGALLATSLPFYRLALDPSLAPDTTLTNGIDSLSYLLASYYQDRPAIAYKQRILEARKAGREFIYLNRRLINFQTRKQMERWPVLRAGRRSGVIFEKIEKRYMPFRHLAFRTVGFMNEDGGGAGIERSYHRTLAGQNGEAVFRKMAGGYWRPVFEIRKPTRGLDLTTTLDVNIQDVAEASLEAALERHQASSGCVVVMKVETGEIKAIANLGRTAEGKYTERFNYAIGGRCDPGSTMKLASYMALLEEGHIKPDQIVDAGQGSIQFGTSKLTDHQEGGYGKITCQRAFEVSSNVAVSRLVHGCFGARPTKYLDYLHRFGLDLPLEMQIQGEAKPYIKTPGDPTWSTTTLPWMSVGYEVLLSPMQMLTFYNAVANGGKMVRPLLIRNVMDGDRVIERYEPEVILDRIATDKTLEAVKRMLIGVVERGTAAGIRHTDFTIAGKTGTAQKMIDGRYTQRYYTSFCGFFPAERPKYSCIVVIDEPTGWWQHGADVSAPVFKEVAERIHSLEVDMHLPLAKTNNGPGVDFALAPAGLHTDLGLLCDELGVSHHPNGAIEEWVRATKRDKSLRWTDGSVPHGRMPNMKGMTLRDALYLLENRGLHVTHQGQGRIIDQFPAAGQAAVKGSRVRLLLK